MGGRFRFGTQLDTEPLGTDLSAALRRSVPRLAPDMKNERGFSLMELIIVITVVMIVATLAIPNFLAARRASNEASAISTLRNYHGAQVTYFSTVGAGSYAGTIGGDNAFGILRAAQMLDDSFELANPADDAIKSGFRFFGASLPRSSSVPASHGATGVPNVLTGVAATGGRKFVIVTAGQLHGDDLTGPLWITDAPGYFDVVGPRPIGD